jgi:hypothetical protein
MEYIFRTHVHWLWFIKHDITPISCYCTENRKTMREVFLEQGCKFCLIRNTIIIFCALHSRCVYNTTWEIGNIPKHNSS